MEDTKIVIDNLEEFINRGLEKAIQEGLEKACLIVEADAKRNAPVDDGQLRQSITHKVSEFEGVIGTNVEYAPYVEIGTGIYSTEGTGRKTAWIYQDEKTGEMVKTKGMKAQPFLVPALESNRKDIEKCFEGLVWKRF